MRPDRLFLEDIVNAADGIVHHVAGRGESAVTADRTTRAAILHELAVIGEAAARVTEALRCQHPEIPWAEIIAFRNVVIHQYFGLSWSIIWVTATEDVPNLRTQVAELLRADTDGGE